MQKKTDVSEEDYDRLMSKFGELNCCDVWSRVTRNDFTVRRFAMGYVNDICCCELTPAARTRLIKSPTDCAAIVVKFAPPQLFFEQSRLEVVANNTIISENGLCPRLIFIDDKCIINEFVPCRNYNQDDDLDPATVAQCARVLGAFHSLKSPVSSSGFHKWQKMSEDMDKMPGIEDLMNNKYLETVAELGPEYKEKYCTLLANLNLKTELDYCKQIMEAVKSPLVFSHSDFNRGNRLVKEVTKEDGTKTKEIYLVDFDYSTYNYRGFDLGRYFSNYRHVDDMFGNEGFPEDKEMSLFLDSYREECAKAQGPHYLEEKVNSVEQLIRETKVFVLNSYTIDYFFCLMMFAMDPKSPKKDYFLQSAKNRYEAYLEAKKRFTEDGTLLSVLATSNGSA